MEHADAGAQWVRISVLDIIVLLDSLFGDLGQMASDFWNDCVQPALDDGILVSPISGTNYVDNPVFVNRSRLALQLYFDAVVTSANALGRAALATRKFYVFSIRICNIPRFVKEQEMIIPIAIVPPSAWVALGFDGVIKVLKPEFDELFTGTLTHTSSTSVTSSSLISVEIKLAGFRYLTLDRDTFGCCNLLNSLLYACPSMHVGVTLIESGNYVSGAILSVHADNEAAQVAAGVTTSSGSQFCRQCNATKEHMWRVPEYVFIVTQLHMLDSCVWL